MSSYQVSIFSFSSSSSSSSAFPAIPLGFTIYDPTIKVVTFRYHRWWVLGMILLLAFTCLGHEYQDLLGPCNGMHVCTYWILVYTLIRKSLESSETKSL